MSEKDRNQMRAIAITTFVCSVIIFTVGKPLDLQMCFLLSALIYAVSCIKERGA